MEDKKTYEVDGKFLESVRHQARLARSLGGVNTPDPAVNFVKAQLLNDLVNGQKITNELLAKLIEALKPTDEVLAKQPEEIKEIEKEVVLETIKSTATTTKSTTAKLTK